MATITRVLALVVLLVVAAPRARAVDFAVDSTADAVDAAPGDGVCAAAGGACTLRAAIQEANALAGTDRVLLPAGTFTLTIAGQDEDAAATGDLDVTDALTIEGAGPGATIVDAAGIDRVFDVSVDTTIRELTVTGGDPGSSILGGGGIYSAPFGADYTLTIEHVRFTANTAVHGGAIRNDTGSTLVVRQSSFSGNSATFGAAVENQETATLENTTVSGNGTGSGGGLRNDGTLALDQVTVVGDSIVSSSEVTLRATILDAGAGGTVCVAPTSATSNGDNVEHGTSCALVGAGDQSGVDPLLGALADAGDGTLSHALLAGSPAIDVVAGCPPPDVDQRGVARPIDGDLVPGALCDAGAIEAPAPGGTTTSTSVATTSSTSTTVATSTSTSTTATSTSTTSTIVATTSTTSTSVQTSTSSSTTVPGSSTTTTSVVSTTSTVSSTVTTTTIGGSTTTTTLPAALLLTGRKLLLTDSPTRPAKRKAVLLSKDPALTLGDGNGSADDPVVNGGSLRVVAVGGDGFDTTYDLPPEGWVYLKGEGNDRGYKFRRGTPVRKLILKPGKSLKILAKGDALAHTLTTQPDAVRVELRLGARRYCFEFGGTPTFKAARRYKAKNAGAPTACPSDPPGP
jgi:CSLREA domain-containing protein